jgi:hypothetical protein
MRRVTRLEACVVRAEPTSGVQPRDDIPGEAFELLELISDGPEEDAVDRGSSGPVIS